MRGTLQTAVVVNSASPPTIRAPTQTPARGCVHLLVLPMTVTLCTGKMVCQSWDYSEADESGTGDHQAGCSEVALERVQMLRRRCPLTTGWFPDVLYRPCEAPGRGWGSSRPARSPILRRDRLGVHRPHHPRCSVPIGPEGTCAWFAERIGSIAPTKELREPPCDLEDTFVYIAAPYAQHHRVVLSSPSRPGRRPHREALRSAPTSGRRYAAAARTSGFVAERCGTRLPAPVRRPRARLCRGDLGLFLPRPAPLSVRIDRGSQHRRPRPCTSGWRFARHGRRGIRGSLTSHRRGDQAKVLGSIGSTSGVEEQVVVAIAGGDGPARDSVEVSFVVTNSGQATIAGNGSSVTSWNLSRSLPPCPTAPQNRERPAGGPRAGAPDARSGRARPPLSRSRSTMDGPSPVTASTTA